MRAREANPHRLCRAGAGAPGADRAPGAPRRRERRGGEGSPSPNGGGAGLRRDGALALRTPLPRGGAALRPLPLLLRARGRRGRRPGALAARRSAGSRLRGRILPGRSRRERSEPASPARRGGGESGRRLPADPREREVRRGDPSGGDRLPGGAASPRRSGARACGAGSRNHACAARRTRGGEARALPQGRSRGGGEAAEGRGVRLGLRRHPVAQPRRARPLRAQPEGRGVGRRSEDAGARAGAAREDVPGRGSPFRRRLRRGWRSARGSALSATRTGARARRSGARRCGSRSIR
jgi:hypothetical protein